MCFFFFTLYSSEVPGETCYVRDPIDYQGKVSIDMYDKPCLAWDKEHALGGTYGGTDSWDFKDNTFPENFCRLPSDSTLSRPWCYIDGGSVQYCNIYQCGKNLLYQKLKLDGN